MELASEPHDKLAPATHEARGSNYRQKRPCAEHAALDRILTKPRGEDAALTERIPLAFVDYILGEAARPERLRATT